MKTLLPAIVCSMFLFLFSAPVARSQQYADRSANDTTNYPYWMEMMQNPDVNFFKTQDAFKKFWGNRTYTKGAGYKVFKRWEYITQGTISPDGTIPKPENTIKEYENFKNHSPETITANWYERGPVVYPTNFTTLPIGMGRINGFGFHPTNPNLVYAAAPSGGLWRTYDGGLSWNGLTDDMPTLGVSTIVVDQNNPEIIYIGTGDRDAHEAPGLGVYKSINNGETFLPSNTGMGNVTVNMMLMNPGNHQVLLAATSGGIYKTSNGGASWVLKSSDWDFKDIKYKPGDTAIAYATCYGVFFRTTNGGESWNWVSNGVIAGSRLVIGVSPAQPDWVYLCQTNPRFAGLLKSTNSGASFVTQSTSPNIMGYNCAGADTSSQANYDLAICINPSDANIVYVGGINIFRSATGGQYWNINAHWQGDCDAVALHADIHCIEYSPSWGLYCGCDGGMYFSSNGFNWTNRSNGLAIAQVYKIGQSNYSQNLTMNGYQDNGTSINDGDAFNTIIGGDGMECAIDWSDNDYKYGSYCDGDIQRAVEDYDFEHIAYDKEGDCHGITESGAWVTPFLIDRDNPNLMYAGYKNVWKTSNVKDSDADDVIWHAISSYETHFCRVLAQPALDNNILYVAREAEGGYPGTLKRTDNAGATTPTWITCTLPGGGIPNDIETHPYDLNIIYAVTANGVYKSYDRGMTWDSITWNLPNVAKNCIVYEIGPVEALYVGTKTGVYYWNQYLPEWVSYSTNLPVSVDVRELEIFYSSTSSAQRLKAATYGRGLWDSPLFVFPGYPTYVQASDSAYPDKVHVRWSPATGRNYYKVYRGTFNNASMATEVSGWITSLEFDDFGVIPGITQYYWVKAATDASGSSPSDFSESDAGSTFVPGILIDDDLNLTSSNPQLYTFNHPYSNWCVVGVRGNSPSENWGISLYQDNTFSWLRCASDGVRPTNFVLIDNNHEPVSPNRGIKVSRPSGTSTAYVEYEGGSETINVHTVYPFTWMAGDVAEAYEIHLTPGTYNFSMHITAGSANLDIALYGSVDGSYFKILDQALAYSMNPGGGVSESMDFTCTVEDDYAFVIYSNDNNPAGGYFLIQTPGMWTGAVDNNWHNPSNWSGSLVPDAAADVTIPPVTRMPWIYESAAVCKSLNIQPGTSTYLRVYNQTLTVNGNLTIHGQLMMDNPTPDAEIIVTGDVSWESGSTAYFTENTSISLTGYWYYKSGANVQLEVGDVVFTGSTSSYIFCNSAGCTFPSLTLNKSAADVFLDASSDADVTINGQFTLYPGSTFYGYSDHVLFIKGSVQSAGHMYISNGTTTLNGSFQAIYTQPDDFFLHLSVNASTGVILSSNIDVHGNLVINTGYLNSNGYNISIKGDWNNQVGADGFLESTGRVIFTGSVHQYCGNEIFNILEINKPVAGAFRVWLSNVSCNQYEWKAGAVDVNVGVFTALDLLNNGIYGNYFINPYSYVNLTNNDGWIDLNGNIYISGGEFNVFGGTDDSYWSYSNNVDIQMTGGVIDFHDRGINMGNFSPNVFTSTITGGTIRTSKNLILNQSAFTPTNSVFELYGTDASTISQTAGSFWDLKVNKTASTMLTPLTDLHINGNLDVLQGKLLVNNNIMYVSGNLNVTSTIVMNDAGAVVRVAGNTNWNSGSAVTMNADATFRALGDWTFQAGANAQFNNGKVLFLGTSNSNIISNATGSYFNDILCSKTSPAQVMLSGTSEATCNIKGDLLIYSGNTFSGQSLFPLSVEGTFVNDGHYHFDFGEVILKNNGYPITPGTGDYFNHLTLNSPGVFTFGNTYSDTLNMRGNFTINAGGLNMNSKILAFGGNWNNQAGETAFVEGTGKVIASGNSVQHILNSETYYDFRIESLGPYAYYADVQLCADLNLHILNNLDIYQGTLWLYNNNQLTIGNTLNISNTSGLSAASGTSVSISLAGDLNDANIGYGTYNGFNPGTSSTFTFNGSIDQYINNPPASSETFHHMVIDKTGGSFLTNGNFTVLGNFSLQQGSFYNTVNERNFTFYGDMATNTGTNFYPGGTIVMKGGNNQAVTFNGNGYIGNFQVAKDLQENTVTLHTPVLSLNGSNLEVAAGTLSMNGNYYRCTGNIDIQNNGILHVDEDAWLEVGSGKTVTVSNGGILKLIGSEGHYARLTHHLGNYNLTIASGGKLAAYDAVFEYMDTQGVNVEAGALVDETYNLSRSVFRFGAPGGRLLTMNNTQDLVVYYADFPTNFTGSLYNVSKTNDAGSITFVDASGDFSGESFEQDPYGRVNWGLVPKSLSINVLLEGLYNPVTHKMNKARNGNVEQYPGDVADKITVELRSASNYSTLIYSIPNIDLSTNGQATTTVPGTYSGMYYITIRHRNHVTTTTSTPVSFSGTPVNYSFNNPSQAFGGNLKLLPTGAYGIYAGNVNIDNKVDNSDLYCIRTDAAAFASGYLTNDVNGDGIVDVLDLIMTDNNVAAFIMVKTPE